MAANPVADAQMASQGSTLVGAFARTRETRPAASQTLEVGRPGRTICLYPAPAGYDLQEELEFLTNRAIEPNVFFSGGFLAPAMPRLDDRTINLAIMRDENETRSRLRFLMPYSVEKPGFSVGPSIMRAWSNPFGPLGVPLLDREEAAESIANILSGFADRSLGLPPVLVLPNVRLDGAFTQLFRAVAISQGLTLTETSRFMRPILKGGADAEEYLKNTISKNHLREMRRQWRKLERLGEVTYNVARQPAEILHRMEEFLALEASGWKGSRRTAMVIDRYRAAFAREAITNLAAADGVRIHTIDLDGRAVASMVVFVQSGEAYTWKTAYDEVYSAFSPGKLLMMRLTEWHLDDPNIVSTDSCAVPDHPIMSRFWGERMPVGTLIVGLKPNLDREVRQVATQLHLYRNTRNMARIIRERLRSITRSDR